MQTNESSSCHERRTNRLRQLYISNITLTIIQQRKAHRRIRNKWKVRFDVFSVLDLQLNVTVLESNKKRCFKLCKKHELTIRINWKRTFELDLSYSDSFNSLYYKFSWALTFTFLANIKKVIQLSTTRGLRFRTNEHII